MILNAFTFFGRPVAVLYRMYELKDNARDEEMKRQRCMDAVGKDWLD